MARVVWALVGVAVANISVFLSSVVVVVPAGGVRAEAVAQDPGALGAAGRMRTNSTASTVCGSRVSPARNSPPAGPVRIRV